jgi:hypothetical protein
MTLNVRRVWDMYVHGTKPRHIAKELGLPIGTVRTRLQRAKEELGAIRGDLDALLAEAAGPRCPRCRLQLPCDPCVPSAREMASRSNAITYPAGADGR